MSIKNDVINIRTPKASFPVLKAIEKRFSPRVYNAISIPEVDINSMLEAARLAPSARYHQPWFFYVVNSGSKQHDRLFTCIPDRNWWAKTAPVVVIACYDPTEPKDGTNKWAQYDLGAAVMSFILQATELGYSCRQIGSFDCDKTKEEFSIPNPLIPFTLIVVGKQGADEDYNQADPEIVQKDLTPNPRKTVIFKNLSD